MFGEDASGRKVSLLNDHHEPPSSSTSTTPSTNIHNRRHLTLSTRSNLPHRCRHSYPASLSSQHSKESSTQSSCSSISCSPPHSPPTPPLVRLDSQSSSSRSLNTPSPMSHNYTYNFEPSDPNGINKPQASGLPYYPNGSRQYNGGDDGTSYPLIPEQPIPLNPYTRMQPLQPQQAATSPAYPIMDPTFPPQASFQRVQAASVLPYQANSLPTPHNQPQRHQSHHHVNIHPMITSPFPIQPNLPPLPLSATEPNFASPSSTTPSTPITATSATSPVRGTPATTTTTTSSSSNSTTTSNPIGAPPVNKKRYHCPHASQYGCSDTFTTSGHAARHGKKHTGEKNVQCPYCKKSFTRKDNMKQHQRTHKEGRSSDQTTAGGSNTPSPTTTTSTSFHSRTLSGSAAATGTTTPAASAIAAASTLSEPFNYHDPEEDADGDVDMDIAPTQLPNSHGHVQAPTAPMGPPPPLASGNLNHRTQLKRPPPGRTQLSEIVAQEHRAAAASRVGAADLDADGEEVDDEDESVGAGGGGLDVLATVGGMARRR